MSTVANWIRIFSAAPIAFGEALKSCGVSASSDVGMCGTVSRVAFPFSAPYFVCQLTVIPCHHPTMGTDPCPTENSKKKKSNAI